MIKLSDIDSNENYSTFYETWLKTKFLEMSNIISITDDLQNLTIFDNFNQKND